MSGAGKKGAYTSRRDACSGRKMAARIAEDAALPRPQLTENRDERGHEASGTNFLYSSQRKRASGTTGDLKRGGPLLLQKRPARKPLSSQRLHFRRGTRASSSRGLPCFRLIGRLMEGGWAAGSGSQSGTRGFCGDRALRAVNIFFLSYASDWGPDIWSSLRI